MNRFWSGQGPLVLAFLFAFISSSSNNKAVAFHNVVTGTGALEVQLITAKLALKAGDSCSIICQTDSNFVKKCIALMYGEDAGRNYDSEAYAKREMPQFVSSGDAIENALTKADNVIVVCEEKGVDNDYFDTLLSTSPNLKHVALLSRQGGKLKSMENYIREKCAKLSAFNGQDISLSIIRAGTLVGGGPGDVDRNDGEEWGLSKYFYDTKYDLSDAMITMAFDKFTVGAKVAHGDPFKGPNFISKMMSNNSFEPRDVDTGRTAAAQALLAAVRRVGRGVDISISTGKATTPPSPEVWDSLLEQK